MSQCQNNAKKRSLKLLCAVFIIQKLREGEFGFGWTIWTKKNWSKKKIGQPSPPLNLLQFSQLYTAKCQKLFYKA